MRLSGYTGGQIASYLDRNDAPDFTRSALIAGVRANVEAHRTFGASGGIFQLDRLRHIVGLDVGYGVRAFDSRTIAETPQFDYRDMTEDRGEAVVSLRNRLQTRGLEGELRTLLDLRLDYFDYVNGIGPYGIEQDGEVSAYLRGQPREEFFVSGEASWAIGPDEFENGFFGVGTRNFERATIFTGLRYLRGEAITPIIDISWRWSDKYEVRLREAYNFRDDRNSFRLLLRRHSQDHIIVFGASVRESDDVTFQFSFEPTFDRDPGDLQGFNDEPAFDPWGTVGWWHTR